MKVENKKIGNLLLATGSLEDNEFIRLISQSKWSKINDLIESFDHIAFQSNHQENIKNKIMRASHQPSIVHYACMFQPPLDIIQILLNYEKQSISVPNTKGWLPLHVACNHSASDEIIKYLVEQNPSSVRHIDRQGRNALHLVFENDVVSPIAVDIIVTAYPSSATIEDFSGVSALESALLHDKIDVECIMAINRAINKEKNEQGKTISISELVPGRDMELMRNSAVSTPVQHSRFDEERDEQKQTTTLISRLEPDRDTQLMRITVSPVQHMFDGEKDEQEQRILILKLEADWDSSLSSVVQQRFDGILMAVKEQIILSLLLLQEHLEFICCPNTYTTATRDLDVFNTC